MSEQPAVLYEGPQEIRLYGRDATGWRWFLNGFEVVVEISNTAMEADIDSLSERVAEARRTLGESEIIRKMDWPVPPDTISLATDD